jgi:hypothetical protein
MNITYTGETRTVQTVDGKDILLEKGVQLECMEKEYHSAATIRAVLPSGVHVKVKRSEVKKIA